MGSGASLWCSQEPANRKLKYHVYTINLFCTELTKHHAIQDSVFLILGHRIRAYVAWWYDSPSL